MPTATTSKTPREIRRPYKLEEGAEALGCHPFTLARAISWGMIPTFRIGRARRIAPETIDRLQREGIPFIPPGYRRMTTGPTNRGRPAKHKAEIKGKAKPAAKRVRAAA